MDRTDLAFAGIARQAELIRSGEVSARELVELCLERIARIDPQLNAVRVVFAERALAEADQAAGRRGAGDERPLLGVPVLVKDDTDVAGEVTCKGSAAEDRPAREDAEVVRRLRGAGAIVLGKTHVPELMQWPFTESATWGITRNPWALDRSPGGSSGGSAAAVAAGLAGGATASDGAGSIRIPAACCALYGLKPQRGRIPTAPYDITWQGLTHVGCVTRSVRDTALWWDVVADRFETDAPGTWVEAVGREPGRLRIACATNNALFAPLAKEQRARSRRRSRCCPRSATRSSRSRCRTPTCSATSCRATCAASRRTPPRSRTRGGWSGARARWRGWGGCCPTRSSRGRARTSARRRSG